jgi:hypothetical protein
MRKGVLAFAVLVAVLVPAISLAGSTASQSRVLKVKMSGMAEVPKGDNNASGTVTVTLDAARGKVCWTFALKGVTGLTAAHIHKAPAGKAGPVVVPFGAKYKPKGCTTAPGAMIKAILAQPTAYYVNVHNAAFPGGAARGQL